MKETRMKNDSTLIRLTDMGNAQRFAQKLHGKVLFCTPRKKWLIWHDTKWSWDETGEVVELAKFVIRDIYTEATRSFDEDTRKAIAKWASKSESKQRIDAMIALAQSETGIAVLPNQLDANPYLLGVKNGVLNLETGELIPSDPDQLITKQLGARYNSNAKSDLWNGFLDDITCGEEELKKYLQRVVGYSLFGSVCEKQFWFLFGPPDTGKSRFIGAIKTLFGDYGKTADFSTWCVQTNAGGNRGDLVDLLGARLVVSVEVRAGAKFDEAILKKVTGGDDLKFAAKYEKEIEFKPCFTLLLAANDSPTIRDDDQGVWTRLCRIPFSNTIQKDRQDRNLEEKLAEDAVQSAILNWAIEGFREWKKTGIGTCSAVESSNSDYRKDMDRIERFFTENCELGPSGKVSVKDLRESYEDWAKSEGIYPLNPREFNSRLREKRCSQTRVNGQKGWLGLSLKAHDELALCLDIPLVP